MTEHKFDEWRVEKEATYEEKGVKSRICMVCGCVENEVIPVTEVEKNQENVKEEKPLYKAPEMIVFIHNNQMQLPEKSVKNENGNKKKQIINVSKKADKTVVYKSSKIKKKKVSFDIAAKAEGRITYKVTKGAKYISVSKKGKVTIKKKTKKGTYKILVTASDTARSFGAKRYIYIKIK